MCPLLHPHCTPPLPIPHYRKQSKTKSPALASRVSIKLVTLGAHSQYIVDRNKVLGLLPYKNKLIIKIGKFNKYLNIFY